jgi:hypothetical protein
MGGMGLKQAEMGQNGWRWIGTGRNGWLGVEGDETGS